MVRPTQYIICRDRHTTHHSQRANVLLTVLLLTIVGGPGSHKDLRHLSDAILRTNSSVEFIRFDLPGYGDSDRCVPSSKEFADKIIESLEILGHKSPEKKVVVLGHSLGGHIAMEICARFNVAGLVLLAPVCCRPHRLIGGDKLVNLVKKPSQFETYFYRYFWISKSVGLVASNPFVAWVLELGSQSLILLVEIIY